MSHPVCSWWIKTTIHRQLGSRGRRRMVRVPDLPAWVTYYPDGSVKDGDGFSVGFPTEAAAIDTAGTATFKGTSAPAGRAGHHRCDRHASRGRE